MAANVAMITPAAAPSDHAPVRKRPRIGFAASLVLAALLAWSNSFCGPFVFDDRPAILANPSLESFRAALSPPRDGGTVAGRPLVNLSLALNRAMSGSEVWSYHVTNLLIHTLAGLTLFGLIRRTLATRLPCRAESPDPATYAERRDQEHVSESEHSALAFAAALLWLVHPLQTSAVTYVVQRAESLMALCFLFTLYAFARATERPRIADASAASHRVWTALCVASCLAGMACKEAMVVAPVVVLLYDRTFVSGTFAAAFRARRWLYLALGGTWLPLAWLVFINASRAGTAGFGDDIAWTHYVLTQAVAIVTYLKLAVWPAPLIFDYGTDVERQLAAVWPHALVVIALLVLSIVALRRWRLLGFLGAAFFLMLAPTSSVLPIHTQTIAEHRMYLPLATIAVGVALGLHAVFRRRVGLAAVVLAVPLAAATYSRNQDYRSALALWEGTMAKRPQNPRAHNHLATALAQAGRTAEAIPHFETALRLAPRDATAHNNLANALVAVGRAADALPHYEAAVQIEPDSSAARLNLANALLRADRPGEALPHFETAAHLAPGALDVTARYNFGVALVRTRQVSPAIEHFRAVIAADPGHVAARVNLANALLLTGRPREAIDEYEAALRLRPNDPQIKANLQLARTQL